MNKRPVSGCSYPINMNNNKNSSRYWQLTYEGNSKRKVPYFYLNNITTYRATHEAEILIQSHISFTSPHGHQVCLDNYRRDISICQVLHRRKMRPGHVTIS
jgi:hypothetical protein